MTELVDDAPIYVDAAFVVACFEEASATLRALPWTGHSPALSQPMVQVVHEQIEAYGYTETENRSPAPSAADIDEMGRTFLWLTLIPHRQRALRRVIALRSVTFKDGNPMSWRSVARKMGCDDRAAKRWHQQAIEIIVHELNRRNNPLTEQHKK